MGKYKNVYKQSLKSSIIAMVALVLLLCCSGCFSHSSQEKLAEAVNELNKECFPDSVRLYSNRTKQLFVLEKFQYDEKHNKVVALMNEDLVTEYDLKMIDDPMHREFWDRSVLKLVYKHHLTADLLKALIEAESSLYITFKLPTSQKEAAIILERVAISDFLKKKEKQQYDILRKSKESKDWL
ncbi:MAG: hypothetical protein NC402_04210 [Prevotella sp.]|nr:hypothetical protein [Prevotella sp.]MCM1074193.1 hypothetical protein [Ruminococcus sp.]